MAISLGRLTQHFQTNPFSEFGHFSLEVGFLWYFLPDMEGSPWGEPRSSDHVQCLRFFLLAMCGWLVVWNMIFMTFHIYIHIHIYIYIYIYIYISFYLDKDWWQSQWVQSWSLIYICIHNCICIQKKEPMGMDHSTLLNVGAFQSSSSGLKDTP